MAKEYICETRIEEARECGYRHSNDNEDPEQRVGIYLVGGGPGMGCGRLHWPLVDAEGEPMKFFRSIKQINPQTFFADNIEPISDACFGQCLICPLGGQRQPVGFILFVGKDNYSIEAFNAEAVTRGISRRVGQLPDSFVPGVSWVYLAHMDACNRFDPIEGKEKSAPGIFRAFRPTVELVIDNPRAIPEKAKALKDKYGDGAKLIKVLPV